MLPHPRCPSLTSPPSSVVILVSLGGLATYTGYVIGQFKWKYPQVCNMADAGEVLAGRFGRELLGMGQIVFLVFIMASHLLTFAIAMNDITNHGTCSIVFGVAGLVISYACTLPRTLAKMSWLSLVCKTYISSWCLGISDLGQHSSASCPP